ncbi:hypothetical protein U9M48_014370 [Paspalum notatum var. saurae]|uniref:DUF8040 domain-containing protein n=1 Tax=Paspalum notatum var. saurae TaxID=547442 RepID=A0AAQ3WKQ1_PASNO
MDPWWWRKIKTVSKIFYIIVHKLTYRINAYFILHLFRKFQGVQSLRKVLFILQNEELLIKLFKNITNDESDHWNPMTRNPITPESQVPIELDDDCTPIEHDNLYDGASILLDGDAAEDVSPSVSTVKKRSRAVLGKQVRRTKSSTAVVMQEHVKRIADSADAIATKRLGEISIKQVMDLVVACGATFGSNEHFIATKLFVKREQREMFMTLDTDERRFLWLRMIGTDSGEDDMEFIRMVSSGGQITTEYIGMYIDKNPPRTSTLSGMKWLKETLHTPGECHSQLRMSTEIFMDLHDLLVKRYGLQPSLHMSTYESLAIFLFICGGNESNRRSQNRFKHSGETKIYWKTWNTYTECSSCL